MNDVNLIDCCFEIHDADCKTKNCRNDKDEVPKSTRRSKSRRQKRRVKKTVAGCNCTGKSSNAIKLIISVLMMINYLN